MHCIRNLALIVVIVVLSAKNSFGQSEDAAEEIPSTCSDDIEMCKDDFGNSEQTREDVLLYKQCINDVNCDGNDDDTALKDKEVAWANKNVMHYSLLDDKENNLGTKLVACVSPLTISLFSLLVFVCQRMQ